MGLSSWKRFALVYGALLLLTVVWLVQANRPESLMEVEGGNRTKLACVSYAPYYQRGQSPFVPKMFIAPAQIDSDLKRLAQLTDCVRTYSVGQGLDYVPEAASKLGLKVLLGAWVGWTDQDNRKEIQLAVQRANTYPSTVKALIVGNEVMLRREQTEQSMQNYLRLAKSQTAIPVTYADVWEFWIKHKGLQQEVDFVTVHILPYWEDKPVSIAQGVIHAEEVMTTLNSHFQKPILIGETGWPSVGRERSGSVPSLVNEARYVREFLNKAQELGWQYNIIEAVDQPWKRELEGTVGGYWGIFSTDLTPKFGLTGGVAERRDGVVLLAIFLLVSLAYVLFAAKNVQSFASHPSRSYAFIGYGALGGLLSIYGYLMAEYLWTACRDPLEWIALSGTALTGVAVVLAHARLTVCSLAAKRIFWASLFLLLAAAVSSWLLMTDGRYRNFPILLFSLPTALLWLGAPDRTRWLVKSDMKQLVSIVGGIGLLCAVACVVKEPTTLSAYVWLIVQGLLWASVLSRLTTTQTQALTPPTQL